MTYYLKLGLAQLKPSALVSKCKTIEQSMEGNATFPTPDPALADLKLKREALADQIGLAANGDRVAIADRNKIYDELQTMLRKLAKYVSLMADGSDSAILSSGFDVRKRSEPISRIARPVDFSVKREEHEGCVKLGWKSVRGGMSYVVEMTTSDPALPATTWDKIAVTARSSHKVDNLTPGTYYWFRVSAVGRKETSAHSNVELIMAA